MDFVSQKKFDVSFFLLKVGLQVAYIAVAFIPLWLYLALKTVANPQGFWQNFALAGFGLWILGGAQFFLLVFLAIMSLALWVDD